MKLNHELAFTCCILIIVATEIKCSLRWDGVRFNSSTYMRFPKEAKLTLGSGSKPNYFPVIEYRDDYDPHPALKCTAYIHVHHRCNFTLHVSKGTEEAGIMSAYQFSDTKLAVAWFERGGSDNKLFHLHVRVTSVDLNTCSSVDILNSTELGLVEFYPDSFDLYAVKDRLAKNLSCTSFDVNGKQIGKPTSLVSKDFFLPFAASTKSPSKSFFIYTFDTENSTLSLVDASGKLTKHLVDIGVQRRTSAISYADESSRAICWVNRLDFNVSQVCECAQFDQAGKQLWKNRTQCDGDRPFGVRNLKGGGVVLLSYKLGKNDEVGIAEMRPRQETLKSTVKVRDGPPSWDEDSVKVMDFNEVDRTFFLYWTVSPALTVTYTDLAFFKFSFPSKAHK